MLSVYTWLNYYKLAVVERAEPVVRFHSGGSNAGLLCACEPLHKPLVPLKASGLRVRALFASGVRRLWSSDYGTLPLEISRAQVVVAADVLEDEEETAAHVSGSASARQRFWHCYLGGYVSFTPRGVHSSPCELRVVGGVTLRRLRAVAALLEASELQVPLPHHEEAQLHRRLRGVPS